MQPYVERSGNTREREEKRGVYTNIHKYTYT